MAWLSSAFIPPDLDDHRIAVLQSDVVPVNMSSNIVLGVLSVQSIHQSSFKRLVALAAISEDSAPINKHTPTALTPSTE